MDKKTIEEILASVEWNEEAAILPLFNKLHEINEQKQKLEKQKRIEAEQKKRKEERTAKLKQLMDIFDTIPANTIQQLLDENEGDFEDTVSALTKMVHKQEEEEALRKQNEQKKLQEQRIAAEQIKIMQQLKKDVLREKYPELNMEKEVVPILEQTKWDIKESCKILANIIHVKKTKELKSLFQSFSEEDIQSYLLQNDWNTVKTVEVLSNLRDLKKKAEVLPPTPPKVTEESILAKSMVVANDAHHMVQIEKKKQEEEDIETMAQFRKELSSILTIQVREKTKEGGLPGLVPPPLPNQIDILLGKKPAPVLEQESTSVQVLPPPTSNSTSTLSQSTIAKMSVELKLSCTRVDGGNNVSVSWNVTSGTPSNYDWIGLFAVDSTNKNYITYQWTKQLVTGSLSFVSPSNYGNYEFRYIPGGSYEHIATSDTLIVGPEVKIEAVLNKSTNKVMVNWSQTSGNKYSRSWIGFFEKSQSDKNFITWEYASSVSGTLEFEAPIKPTEYHFRYFSYNYYCVATSNIITIEGNDTMTVELTSTNLTCKLNLVSVDPKVDSVWIGLYFASESDNKNWRRYKYVTDRTSDVVFTKLPNTAGIYEARLFANKNFETIVKSTTFELPPKP